MAHLSLSFFGSPRVTLGDTLVESFRYDKVFALLAFLATEADRPHRRERLAGLLWPDQPERAARRSLSQALYSLRAVIDEERAVRPRLLVAGEGLRLNPSADWSLDVAVVAAALDTAATHRHPPGGLCQACVQGLTEAVACYSGPFLAGFSLPDSAPFDEWAAHTREQLHQRVMGALDALAAYHSDTDPTPFLRRQLELEPWHEPAHRRLMAALAAQGDRAGALAQYERCRTRLAAEFGVEPEPETLTLYEAIRQGAGTAAPAGARLPRPAHHDSGSPAIAPPRRRPAYVQTNLPAPLTPLVGREREVDQVCALLRSPNARLVTLTGPGGIGKTRLGLEVAASVIERFADGVTFVDLAATAEPALVVDTIADALGLKEVVGQPRVKQLKQRLREQQQLLLLDNFEHLVEAAPVVIELLKAAPALKVLATSRTPLHLSGEHEYDVPPLSVPDLYQLPPLEQLSQYEAVALFLARARAAQLDFGLTSINAPPVAAICARLDGLPLAIELAAARIRLFTPDALRTRLDQRLAILVGGPRDLPQRQQTLRNTIEWSYQLLGRAEQSLFARLSAFVGGWTLEAAEAVCPMDGDISAMIQGGHVGLLDQSLVRQETGRSGAQRFVMLETLREYAREQLRARGDELRVQRQHAVYYLQLVEMAERELGTPNEAAWLRRLEEERPNFRAALRWAQEQGEADLLLLLAGRLKIFWRRWGDVNEGRAWLEAALAAERWDPATGQPGREGAAPSASYTLAAAYATALHGLGDLIGGAGEITASEAPLEQALHLFRALGDQAGIAHTLNSLAYCKSSVGDFAQAHACLEESMALWRNLNDQRSIAYTLWLQGNLRLTAGDLAAARTNYEQSLVIARQLGDQSGMMRVLHNLGLIASHQGAAHQSDQLYEESMALAQALGDQYWIARIASNMATAAYERGEYEQAGVLYEEGLVVARKRGDQSLILDALCNLGLVAFAQEDGPRAKALLEESLGVARDLQDLDGSAFVLQKLGAVWLSEGASEQAEELLVQSLAILGRLNDRVTAVDCLEELAWVAELQGRYDRAARICGMAAALRSAVGIADQPVNQDRRDQYERHLAAIRAQLGEVAFRQAWTEGEALSWEQAVSYALDAGS